MDWACSLIPRASRETCHPYELVVKVRKGIQQKLLPRCRKSHITMHADMSVSSNNTVHNAIKHLPNVKESNNCTWSQLQNLPKTELSDIIVRSSHAIYYWTQTKAGCNYFLPSTTSTGPTTLSYTPVHTRNLKRSLRAMKALCKTTCLVQHTCNCEQPDHGGWSWGWTGMTFLLQPAVQAAAADERWTPAQQPNNTLYYNLHQHL